MKGYLENVAIIGAGLGGCALALALSEKDVPVTIFESRPEISGVIPSGVILTPNGLRVLDYLGVLPRIKDRCYISAYRVFKNDNDETTKKVRIGGPEVYGYDNHRIWRGLLLDEMRKMLAERSVNIVFNSKFQGVVSDTADGVSFLVDESVHHASLLVGLDGIYSSVRNYLAPEIRPEYTGLVGILSHIKHSSVDWPCQDYEKNATIQSKPGALFWIAEDPTEDPVLMIGKQIHYPEQSRSDLESLQSDREKLKMFYKQDYDEYGPTARKIIDSVCASPETLYIWPFLKMPRLPKWYSDTGRIILAGDGAHALPPSSGQGVNQALEDIYSLNLLLSSVEVSGRSEPRQSHMLDALAFWQQIRQERIDAVFDWTMNGSNVSRLPEAERQRLVAEGKVKENQGDDMSWLYKPVLEERIKAWIDGRKLDHV
ncbi:related to salicylate hydroxylase [Ramularia collo-cygni]|uniref:Related to salicylate hydroxylase n=1 Tax=Ramularia collo-cygni TaxID=112498 RepID=A0A2D3ULU4_9PEZI|nr:related to salicylate hydroxylase [Ramularia collo-cygni]CZT14291.1 related to salicylate hydroxylase [Ramularia collo-cygni]